MTETVVLCVFSTRFCLKFTLPKFESRSCNRKKVIGDKSMALKGHFAEYTYPRRTGLRSAQTLTVDQSNKSSHKSSLLFSFSRFFSCFLAFLKASPTKVTRTFLNKASRVDYIGRSNSILSSDFGPGFLLFTNTKISRKTIKMYMKVLKLTRNITIERRLLSSSVLLRQ